MRNSSKLEKIPAPISLSKRNIQVQLDSATPYRMQWGTPLQVVENSNASSKVHKSTISNMKEQLSNIKTDVEKLLNQDCPQTKRNAPSQLISKSVRAELDYHKEIEEKLRAEIRELKLRLSDDKLLREEREMLERRMEQMRAETKVQRAKLKKVSEQATQKHSLEIRKWQEEYDLVTQKINLLNQQKANLQKIYSQDNNRLLKTVNLLEKQIKDRRDEYETALKERQCKYQNALGQFKKLQTKFDRNTQQSVVSLIHKNVALEQEVSNLNATLEDLKCRLSDQTHKYQRALHYQQELKARNSQLENRLRMPNRHNELTAEVNTLQNKIQNLEASKAQLYTTYLDKCREYEELMDEYQSRVNNPNTELQRLKIENMEISKMSEIVNEQLSLARDRIHYLDAIMIEKDSYIEAMEDMQQFETTNQTIKELEERCMQLLREKSELARDYDNAIRHLESSMAESREKSMSQSMMFSVSPRNRKTTFDEALRQQIQQNEQMRTINKQKSQEIFLLKGQLDELRRQLESQRSERELERMRIMTTEKNTKNNYQLTVQDLRNELESLKRKQQMMQRKIDQKTDDIRKKDDFIRQSIIGRLGKQENESDVQYLTRELEKFISLTALDHIRKV